MPQTRTPTTDPGTRRERVPAGIFLPDPQRSLISHARGHQLAAWHDLAPWDLACLIATYTLAGEVVVNVDAHRTVDLATRYLRRHPAVTVTTTADSATSGPGRARISAGLAARRAFRRRRGAGLVLATLPGPASSGSSDPRGPLDTLVAWRRLLRPGGFLLLVLPERLAPPAFGGSLRGVVVAAARTAGLVYQQHLLVVTRPLAEDEPRAIPECARGIRPMFRAGRHARVHRDLLAFMTTSVRKGYDDV
ncbi:MAG: hypothetical protein JXA67_22715 [Micromonosporaceae bacterium]|nr:hypothetical protein [Micromonosporaceae bacterium]